MNPTSTLDSIKQTLMEHMPKDGKAILFGSRARGDNSPNSDWDILLLLNTREEDDKTESSYSLFRLGWELGEEINPIMYTKDEWSKYSFTPFYHNVNAEGIFYMGLSEKDRQTVDCCIFSANITS